MQLDQEAWDRLVTWIDLNGPCHGTWGEVAEIPGRADQRRQQLAIATGGPQHDPEAIPLAASYQKQLRASPANDLPTIEQRRERVGQLLGSDPSLALPLNAAAAGDRVTLDLGNNVSIQLVRIPAGRFVMGDTTGRGTADEWPASVVSVEHDFWIGCTEITNAQMRALMPEHVSGVFTKRQIDRDGPGLQLDEPDQPAVRVSWTEAKEYCRRLSATTGRRVTLPTEAQWEYAARAGSMTDLSYGTVSSDFSTHANMADRSLACLYEGTAGVAVMQPFPAIMDLDDEAIATAKVASYLPNAWGLYDMHGNAAEWTRSLFQPYPYDTHDGRDSMQVESVAGKRVVRGGSFHGRPIRCRSSFRQAYAAWQGVHDVGFRIVIQQP